MLNANEFLKELYARLDSQNVNYKGQISVADFTDNALAKIKYRAFEGYFPKTVEPELIVSSKKT